MAQPPAGPALTQPLLEIAAASPSSPAWSVLLRFGSRTRRPEASALTSPLSSDAVSRYCRSGSVHVGWASLGPDMLSAVAVA
jgi:hypothetical protein